MEFNKTPTVEEPEPVSPHAQYLNSSVLSICVLAVLESEVPIDDSQTTVLLEKMLLPINPRFSSIMVLDDHGVGHWKKVEVKLEDHVRVAVFPDGLPATTYDECFQEYMSKISMEMLPQSRPLWEIHLFKYPTSNAAGTVVLKFHHALGDGFSLMGALFSCTRRADDPSLPLTFPSSRPKPIPNNHGAGGLSILKKAHGFVSLLFNSASDFAWSLLKSSFLEDEQNPIRSGTAGVEFRPKTVSTVNLSLDRIGQIKEKIGGTINDVLCGVIFYGVRLYMYNSNRSSSHISSTALVLLNTRIINNIQSIQEMMKPDTKAPWGNYFAFLHVSIPILDADTTTPLDFVLKARQIVKRKRSSLAVYLNAKLLETTRKFRGPERAAQIIHSTLKNTSLHPVSGLYFTVSGVPQSLTITAVSYMGTLRLGVEAEKDFIDNQQFKSCIEEAFRKIFEAALSA
uniref:Diacylglycerol O-acyltransferase n=1 Tax=Nelumbo nucifera TaxID=4432 RepID=A0A822XUU8_NELNU|nr:TPA_asm: hypothetical protein HUJ06_024322 [Nelumbo nucifera]